MSVRKISFSLKNNVWQPVVEDSGGSESPGEAAAAAAAAARGSDTGDGSDSDGGGPAADSSKPPGVSPSLGSVRGRRGFALDGPRGFTLDGSKHDYGGTIKVGPEHQCVIPAGGGGGSAAGAAGPGGGELSRIGSPQWESPQGLQRINDSAVQEYVAAALKLQSCLRADDALILLRTMEYDAGRALELLQSGGGASKSVADRASLDSWSEEEKAAFTTAISKIGKDFIKMHRTVLPGKTLEQLVLYYFSRWKGTQAYLDFQVGSFSSNDENCFACDQGGGLIACNGCPKSYHFSCCSPPLSALNLTKPDWCAPPAPPAPSTLHCAVKHPRRPLGLPPYTPRRVGAS